MANPSFQINNLQSLYFGIKFKSREDLTLLNFFVDFFADERAKSPSDATRVVLVVLVCRLVHCTQFTFHRTSSM